jgi:uncharacterized protein (TIGR04255 family)
VSVSGLPERIEPDAILEALIELRFEPADLPEAVLGRLLDVPAWSGYNQTRLPMADIPQPIREIDTNLRYQPLVELHRPDGLRVAKIGSHVVSYHVVNSYPGWAAFKQEIEGVVREVTIKLKSPKFSRIGFRYINILRPDDHFVAGLADTTVSLKVNDCDMTKSLAINYVRNLNSRHAVTVRIATPDLVGGVVRPGFSLMCDIDVATPLEMVISDYDEAMAWIEEAHTLEKSEFFLLLSESVIAKLKSRKKGTIGD